MNIPDLPQILIVDDNPADRLTMQAALVGLDVTLVPVPSGNEALRHILKHQVALILCDICMPGLDGFETAALIRGCDIGRHIPILFLTAFDSTPDQLLKAYRLGGIVDYLQKPVVAEILKAKLAVYLELYCQNVTLTRTNMELQAALRQVRELRDILPICASCKKIRDDKGYWTQLETYLSAHAIAEFSHGICPECLEKLYGKELADEVGQALAEKDP